MTRHGKNATASAVYTYHERMKDTQEGQYGTQQAVISRDSARNFDCCCLTLQPCTDPVVTPDGYLYEREAILTNLLKQKRKIAKQEKAFSKQKAEEASSSKMDSKEEQFLSEQSSSSAIKVKSTEKSGKSSKLNNFWVPSLQGNVSGEKIRKPDTNTYCPISGKPLKLKHLVSIKFTPMPQDSASKSVICQENRYMCAVTRDALSNSSTCVILKTTGSVITLDCYENLVKKDMTDPTNGSKLKEKDIIILKRGSTGYVGATHTGEELVARKKGAVIMA